MSLAHVDWREVTPVERSALLALPGGAPARVELDALLSACRGEDTAGRVWFLAHCVDGVTWGRMASNRLLTSCGKHPDWPTPVPSAGSLIEVRLFGPGAEALLWRDDTAPDGLAGRLLADVPTPAAGPLGPRDDVYVLAASRLLAACPDDFSVVGEASGRAQLIPLAVTGSDFGAGQHRYLLGLDLKHYFQEDPDSGCARIAASRLVRLRLLRPDERKLIGPGEEAPDATARAESA